MGANPCGVTVQPPTLSERDGRCVQGSDYIHRDVLIRDY